RAATRWKASARTSRPAARNSSARPSGTRTTKFRVRSANESAIDVRSRLREDHERILAELDALRAEIDARDAQPRLAQLRRAWVIHALAEETVVYRALESADAGIDSEARAAERFVEHELVEGLFDK